MKPAQPDKLNRAERSALRRLRDQVRQQRAQSKPASKPAFQPKQEKASA